MGSEMCIRDRLNADLQLELLQPRQQQRTPATPAEAHPSRSTLQQKHTPAEAHSSRRKLPPVERMWGARTATGLDDRSRDHRNEPRVTLKLKLNPTGS